MTKVKFIIYFLVTLSTLYFWSDLLFSNNLASPFVPIIEAPAGKVKGALILSKYGRNISAYRGIPYAKPPIGDLRFKKPELVLQNTWNGILDGSGKVRILFFFD